MKKLFQKAIEWLCMMRDAFQSVSSRKLSERSVSPLLGRGRGEASSRRLTIPEIEQLLRAMGVTRHQHHDRRGGYAVVPLKGLGFRGRTVNVNVIVIVNLPKCRH